MCKIVTLVFVCAFRLLTPTLSLTCCFFLHPEIGISCWNLQKRPLRGESGQRMALVSSCHTRLGRLGPKQRWMSWEWETGRFPMGNLLISFLFGVTNVTNREWDVPGNGIFSCRPTGGLKCHQFGVNLLEGNAFNGSKTMDSSKLEACLKDFIWFLSILPSLAVKKLLLHIFSIFGDDRCSSPVCHSRFLWSGSSYIQPLDVEPTTAWARIEEVKNKLRGHWVWKWKGKLGHFINTWLMQNLAYYIMAMV